MSDKDNGVADRRLIGLRNKEDRLWLTDQQWNDEKHGVIYIRFETNRSHIYGISVQVDHKYYRLSQPLYLLKVGLTRVSPSKTFIQDESTQSVPAAKKATPFLKRTADVINEIKLQNRNADPDVVFELFVDPLNPRDDDDIEKYIRSRCGACIEENQVQKSDLPRPTEWVLTTETFIKQLLDKKEALKIRSTALFKQLEQPIISPEDLAKVLGDSKSKFIYVPHESGTAGYRECRVAEPIKLLSLNPKSASTSAPGRVKKSSSSDILKRHLKQRRSANAFHKSNEIKKSDSADSDVIWIQ